MNEGKEA